MSEPAARTRPYNEVVYLEPLVQLSEAAHLISWDTHEKFWARRELSKFSMSPPRSIVWLMGHEREKLWTMHGELELSDWTGRKWHWKGIEYELPHLLRELPQLERYIVTRTRYFIAWTRADIAGYPGEDGDWRAREIEHILPQLDALQTQLDVCGLTDAYADEAREADAQRRSKFAEDEARDKARLLESAERELVQAQRLVERLRAEASAAEA